ncbi:metallophosphoesterase [Pararcticibacter amylolyticus]|uniref:Metallophosphatase n=1 Tax=Pararcticibacter amylolyticus TaxID=2173175 RepID=A0A2U2PKQ9_9SPHI|nr:metallophosphoesterase [Pararcticibacter amylolyticus]PWG81993.1 metallophosphatase [Pararcticibacter amylolyticus]
MRRTGSRWVIIALILLLDLYVFTALNSLFLSEWDGVKTGIYIVYALMSAGTLASVLLFPYLQSAVRFTRFSNYLFAVVIGLVFSKVVSSAVFLLDDIRRLITWIILSFQGGAHDSVPRSAIVTIVGLVLGTGLFLSLVYGFGNKYAYRIRRIKLHFPKLPQGLKGMRFVQISDIHSGSFQDKAKVNRGIDLILKERPDLILFTGDLVNDRAVEMENYMDVFSRLKAPLGVYSVLGNHDYGDYYWGINPQGEKAREKADNLSRLKDVHSELGWRLLMNEHVELERNGDRMALLGIENWGAKAGFPKYGRMAEAYRGSESYPFKILMSHDPSHWEAEVRIKYPDIDLTLSGHTHGMQFGFELPGLKWSPVQWVYKQWAGLYEAGNQKLYVNRGFGFLGYPGRVGILPEITVFELT